MRKSARFVVTDLEELVNDYGITGDEYGSSDSSSKIICKCPFCIEMGEPNMKSTLYVYVETMSFWCFRCRTAGIDSSLKVDRSQYKISQIKRQVTNRMLPKDRVVFQPLDLDHLSLIRDDEYIKYFLSKRSYKYIPKLDEWGFREIKFMGRKGFIIPFYYEGIMVDYQIRYLDSSNNKMKYYTSEGLKVPYFLGGYSSNNDYSEITLVEGVFDATAASLFNLPNPIALLGSAVPDNIFYIITKLLKPNKIIFAFDDMSINLKLRRQFSKYLHDTFYINTDGKDLDEYLKLGKVPKVSNHQEYIQSRNDRELLGKIGSWLKTSQLTT